MKFKQSILRRLISILTIIAIIISSITIHKNTTDAISNRDIVYNYMYNMATVEWTAEKTYSTVCGTTFYKNVKYLGIPYSQNTSQLITLEKFKSYESITTDIGRNDCSSTVCMSWSQVGFEKTDLSTGYMYPGNCGIKTVGSYTWRGSSCATCSYNGKKVIYDAYAKLQKGDALVRQSGDNHYGHAIMVISVKGNKVKCLEQAGDFYYSDNSTWGFTEY